LYPDFIIIGAGIIGLSTAFELLRRGASVSLIDKGLVGRESSWAGGGILSPLLPWDYLEAVNALTEAGRAAFPGLCSRLRADTGIDPEYRATGMLVLPPVDWPRANDWCNAHGWPFEQRDCGFALARLNRTQGLWLPQVAQVRNPRLLQALRKALESGEATIEEDVEVRALDPRNGRIAALQTSQGPRSAGAYIVATGAWSASLPGLEALEPRVFPVRGQMLLYQAGPSLLNTIVVQDGRYLIPRADGLILAGSTLENVGFDNSVTPTAREELHGFASGLLPQLEHAGPLRQWAGLRPGSPDNIPLIGRHPGFENLFINAGHFRYGVTMAPAAAALLADLALGNPPAIDPAPFRWPDS
jgi:glycine oxidase